MLDFTPPPSDKKRKGARGGDDDDAVDTEDKDDKEVKMLALLLFTMWLRMHMHDIAVAFMSVHLSAHLSNKCTVTKRKNLLPKFLYDRKGPFI